MLPPILLVHTHPPKEGVPRWCRFGAVSIQRTGCDAASECQALGQRDQRSGINRSTLQCTKGVLMEELRGGWWDIIMQEAKRIALGLFWGAAFLQISAKSGSCEILTCVSTAQARTKRLSAFYFLSCLVTSCLLLLPEPSTQSVVSAHSVFRAIVSRMNQLTE